MKQPRSSGSANQFEAMSDRADDEGNTEMAVAGGEDPIVALPDDVRRYLMSFLPSRDAVRTCVLAKSWRTFWKSVPALRISDPESFEGAHGLSTFVDELIRLRDPVPLNVCDISSVVDYDPDPSCDFDRSDGEFRRMEPWLQHAVSNRVQVLRVRFICWVTNMTLISSHLKRVEFYDVKFEGRCLDFSRCQVLEVLELNNCQIFANISSKSIQHLKIDGSVLRGFYARIRIFAPNLTSFQLVAFSGLAPFLESMLSLVTASVKLGGACIGECMDCCSCGNRSCEGCNVQTGNNDSSVVLKSLSGAMNLELTTADNMIVFRNYLKCYPFFGKLKTLLLNEWCTVDNFTVLVYFLQHSPILEALTLQLHFETREEQLVTETDESYNSSVPSIISKHLKVVKIICDTKEDARVHHILKIFRTHGVPTEQIDIQ
ncbi:hypothetical protein ACQ4PT_051233 [Festuca glaucescens]